MKTFTKPKNFNGTELVEELAAVGIFTDTTKFPICELNNLYLDVSDEEYDMAATVVAAHNGTTVAPEPDIIQKLASVGLNVSDLKAALGL